MTVAQAVAITSATITASHQGQPRLIGVLLEPKMASHRHLRQRHHAAVAAEEGQRQRNRP
jgi:hypothetical protein